MRTFADPGEALQIGLVTALLGNGQITAIVGSSVFALGQKFDQTYPRLTLDPASLTDAGADPDCGGLSEAAVTVHCWARGPDSSLVALRLAGLVRRVLDQPIDLIGHGIAQHRFDGYRPAGDPDDETVHMAVSLFYLIHPTA